ncbi:MAG: DUF1311 domain-containing protein [Methylococcales bacterium]|jgi:uncharacterized protein YecT (DUF1311 family)|nr:DUF1311 domain-containing protein [Methylococcales bacterium]
MTHKNFSITLVLFFIIFISKSAFSASFNCNKAAAPVEKLICINTELSSIDGKMGKVYKKARIHSLKNSNSIRQEQRNWLKHRDNKCPVTEEDVWEGFNNKKVTCIITEIKIRISELNNLLQEPKYLNEVINELSKPNENKTNKTDAFVIGNGSYKHVTFHGKVKIKKAACEHCVLEIIETRKGISSGTFNTDNQGKYSVSLPIEPTFCVNVFYYSNGEQIPVKKRQNYCTFSKKTRMNIKITQ